MRDRRDYLNHLAFVGVYLYYASIQGSQVHKLFEQTHLPQNVADSFAKADLVFEDVEGQDPYAYQEVLAAADQTFSSHHHQRTYVFLVELQNFVSFLGDGAVGRQHYFAGLGAVGQKILVFEIQEAESGVLEVGAGFDELVLVLGMDIENVNILVEKKQSQKFFLGAQHHLHDLTVVGNGQNHSKFDLHGGLADHYQL